MMTIDNAIDGVAHFFMGLALTVVPAFLAFIWLPVIDTAILWMVMAVCAVYVREVTQEQGKRYDYNFFAGWNPFVWSTGKQIETLIPEAGYAVVLLVLLLVKAP